MKRTLGICSAMLVVLGLVGCQSNSADNSPKQETSSKHQTKTESEHSSKAKLAASV
uniref:Putative lipoprotein n=1 Tax=Lacticaseibacillus paracasei TaxID=1597 RepID=A0A0M6W9W0_LACPA|nr:putative lipoprotein [Lacticaseibacillus paracasei]